MHLCYIDESGKAEQLTRADTTQQPVVVIAGVTLPEECLRHITHDWIKLKARFYPDVARMARRGWLDAILHDVKAANLRKGFRRSATTRQRKHSTGMIDGTLRILEKYECRLVGRIWVKKLDTPNEDMAMHQSSLQFICDAFHSQIPADERGMVVVDSQTYWHNHRLAHSVFSQRFAAEPKHQKLADMPVFGHSDNHAGLQIADLLCSALLAPIACAVYAGRYEKWNVHCYSSFLDIRERFGRRVGALTFTWPNPKTGTESASLVVNDPIGKRGTNLMWEPAAHLRPIERRQMTRLPQPPPKRLIKSALSLNDDQLAAADAVRRAYRASL